MAPSKQESTTYEPSLVCKLLILGCRLLIPDRLLGVQQILPVCTSVRTRGGHVVQLDVPESLMEAYDSFVALPNLIGPFYEDESEAIEALKSRSSS